MRGLSGLLGGMLPCLLFPGGGIGFLGGTTGAAGLDGLWSGVDLSTETEKGELQKEEKKTGDTMYDVRKEKQRGREKRKKVKDLVAS